MIGLDAMCGAFSIFETQESYIGQSISTELTCTSLAAKMSVTDTFEIVFKEKVQPAGLNPCNNDMIEFQAQITDFVYTISYPANQLLVNVDYNQDIIGCPVDCNLYLAGGNEPLPSQPFNTYGTSGIFSVFTSDSKYDGRTYSIDVKCRS